MQSKQFIVPPKLGQKLMLGGLTVWELFFLFATLMFNLFTKNIMNALFYPTLIAMIFMRIFDGKNLKDIALIIIRYHSTPQLFTAHINTNSKQKGSRYAKKRSN